VSISRRSSYYELSSDDEDTSDRHCVLCEVMLIWEEALEET